MKDELLGMTLPTCEILVNSQKRKLYGNKKNKIYLQNGDNFQLKLFNPLQERIGIQLKMNGNEKDDDLLILSPGQEVIIERFIGTNRKLTFSSYEIDTKNMSENKIKEVKKAIKKNGILEIIFWNEKKLQVLSTNFINIPNSTCPNHNYYPTFTTFSDDFNLSSSSTSTSTSYADINYRVSSDSGVDCGNKIETGRIEKGCVSNQYFKNIFFEVGEEFYKIKFKLLPFSLKPLKKKVYDSSVIKNTLNKNSFIKNESSIREYCKCGFRISRGKGQWKFCPLCGREIK